MTQPPSRQMPPQQVTGAARFIAGVFGFAFAGIGLAVIGGLWFSDGMGDPPIIFKLVGSCIALVFVAMGGAMAFGAIKGGGLLAQQPANSATTSPSAPEAKTGYTCPHCGGGLDRDADVSPMGDVKCSFCGRWFNVHGQKTS